MPLYKLGGAATFRLWHTLLVSPPSNIIESKTGPERQLADGALAHCQYYFVQQDLLLNEDILD